MKNILLGVQYINYIQSDPQHTVISVPNKQVLNNVIDIFKQKSGIAFAMYMKPKTKVKKSNIFKTTYLQLNSVMKTLN